MHASRIALALAIAVAALLPCPTLQAQEQAPIAVPRARSATSAPASAPATTQSAEEALYQQIVELRNLPRVPGGKQLSEVPEIRQAINEQLDKSLQLAAEYLKKYPKSENADEVLIQRLDSIRLQAVVNDKPLDEFRNQARKTLAGDASDKVKSTVAFMLVQADLQDQFKDLKANEQLSEDQKAAAWRKAVVQQANEFIKKYPKSEFAKEFYGVLIKTAVEERNFDRANELLDTLRTNFPDEPAIPQIAQFIQQAAATQAAATQSAGSQPATQPARAPKAPVATQKAPAAQ